MDPSVQVKRKKMGVMKKKLLTKKIRKMALRSPRFTSKKKRRIKKIRKSSYVKIPEASTAVTCQTTEPTSHDKTGSGYFEKSVHSKGKTPVPSSRKHGSSFSIEEESLSDNLTNEEELKNCEVFVVDLDKRSSKRNQRKQCNQYAELIALNSKTTVYDSPSKCLRSSVSNTKKKQKSIKSLSISKKKNINISNKRKIAKHESPPLSKKKVKQKTKIERKTELENGVPCFSGLKPDEHFLNNEATKEDLSLANNKIATSNRTKKQSDPSSESDFSFQRELLGENSLNQSCEVIYIDDDDFHDGREAVSDVDQTDNDSQSSEDVNNLNLSSRNEIINDSAVLSKADEEDCSNSRSSLENYGIRKLYKLNYYFLLLMKHPNEIAIRGYTTHQVIYGGAIISGLMIDERTPPYPVFSPRSQSALTIKTFKLTRRSKSSDELLKQLINLKIKSEDLQEVKEILDDESTVILLEELKHPICKYLSTCMPRLFEKLDAERSLFQNPCDWCSFIDSEERTALHLPSEWYDIVEVFRQIAGNFRVSSSATTLKAAGDQVVASTIYANKGVRNLRILVCGAKNSGKSTFLRFLANSLLTKANDAVYYLDGDVGQSEFTVPGCISLAEIDEPLLGPPFCHQKKLIKSHFVGGFNVKTLPDVYSKCMKSLADHLDSDCNYQRRPLLINTMGWTVGMGLALLLDTIRYLQPMFIIQILQPESQQFREKVFYTTDFLEKQQGWLTNTEIGISEVDLLVLPTANATLERTYVAAVQRSMAIISYFAQLYTSCDLSKPLHGFAPYRVPWSSVGVYVCHEFVPNDLILYVLNAEIVALCICDPSLLKSSIDPSLPKFLSDVPICECVGFGIVRGISKETKEFFILTPVEFKVLKNVNLLLKGSLDLPSEVILNQRVEGTLPYVTEVPVGKTIVGGRTTQKRRLSVLRSAHD